MAEQRFFSSAPRVANTQQVKSRWLVYAPASRVSPALPTHTGLLDAVLKCFEYIAKVIGLLTEKVSLKPS